MKHLRSLTGFAFLLLFSFTASAQNSNLAIGAWREHPPFNKAIEVTENNDGLIYCASKFGLFTYNKHDGEINILSRLKELSDLEIGTMRFDPVTGILLIAYQNSNIDLIYSDKTVVNIPDIKLKNIIGGKHINSILFINKLAYLGCEFGIVVVDIERKEIKDTYYIGQNGTNVNVNGVSFDGTSMLAVTTTGIYKATFSDPNIFNYTAWTKETSIVEPNGNYTSTTSLNGKFYVVKTNAALDKDSVFVYQGNQWVNFINEDTEGAYIDSYNNTLLYRNKFKVAAVDEFGVQFRSVEGYFYGWPDVRRGFLDNSGNFWIADFNNGLIKQNPDQYIEVICPNGPRSESVWSMAGKDGKLWVASGVIVLDSYDPLAKNGIYRFAENNWRTYDCRNDSIYQFLCMFGSPAVNCVAIDPNDADHVFVGSWGSGLLEFKKDGGVMRYNENNSTLHPLNADPNKINVGGVTFDDDGNLWVVACGTTRSISVLKKDQSWQDFIIPETNVAEFSLYDLVVDDFGQKWYCARSASIGQGLCVFKEGSMSSPSGGSFKRLTDRAENGALPDIFVKSIAKDKDGSIWIGTHKGVAVIYNPGNVFSGGNFDAQKIIIQQDGYNQYLLETEIVSAIAVDGANRKWFGTYSGGVFLMSADGTKQLLNFNKDNSPLPSNSVVSIAIDDITGEVFFATDKGIISYRGDATKGGEQCKDYYVFPNPVRHEYTGPIAIGGLVDNADVKISDVAGNVVYHTKANGGVAIWNGTNYKGERAQTGVYFVYVTNEDGSQTCTTKMLFAN
jgi:hypothetical protein